MAAYYFELSMENFVITHPEELTSTWVTAVLKEKGVLSNGRVQTVSFEPLDSQNSNMFRLLLTYEGTENGEMPLTLMLKIVRTKPGEFGESEIAYYLHDYLDLPEAPLVPCYHAAYDGSRHAYHLLLKDVSATHHNNWQKPLTLAYGRVLAEALACLHSHWWGTKRLQQTGINWPYSSQIERHVATVSRGLGPLLGEIKGEVPQKWIKNIQQILAEHPAAMYARMSQDDHFTLIHGDANPGNILSPSAGEKPLYLVDRQPFAWSFTHWLGVFDLAYSLGLWGEPVLRRQFEMEILRFYHEHLQKYGINDYGWAQLVQDYKLCLLQQIYVPLAWCTDHEEMGKMKWVWFPQLQRIMTAVADMNCLEILPD